MSIVLPSLDSEGIDFGDFTQVEDFLCDMDSHCKPALKIILPLRYFSDPFIWTVDGFKLLGKGYGSNRTIFIHRHI